MRYEQKIKVKQQKSTLEFDSIKYNRTELIH